MHQALGEGDNVPGGVAQGGCDDGDDGEEDEEEEEEEVRHESMDNQVGSIGMTAAREPPANATPSGRSAPPRRAEGATRLVTAVSQEHSAYSGASKSDNISKMEPDVPKEGWSGSVGTRSSSSGTALTPPCSGPVAVVAVSEAANGGVPKGTHPLPLRSVTAQHEGEQPQQPQQHVVQEVQEQPYVPSRAYDGRAEADGGISQPSSGTEVVEIPLPSASPPVVVEPAVRGAIQSNERRHLGDYRQDDEAGESAVVRLGEAPSREPGQGGQDEASPPPAVRAHVGAIDAVVERMDVDPTSSKTPTDVRTCPAAALTVDAVTGRRAEQEEVHERDVSESGGIGSDNVVNSRPARELGEAGDRGAEGERDLEDEEERKEKRQQLRSLRMQEGSDLIRRILETSGNSRTGDADRATKGSKKMALVVRDERPYSMYGERQSLCMVSSTSEFEAFRQLSRYPVVRVRLPLGVTSSDSARFFVFPNDGCVSLHVLVGQRVAYDVVVELIFHILLCVLDMHQAGVALRSLYLHNMCITRRRHVMIYNAPSAMIIRRSKRAPHAGHKVQERQGGHRVHAYSTYRHDVHHRGHGGYDCGNVQSDGP